MFRKIFFSLLLSIGSLKASQENNGVTMIIEQSLVSDLCIVKCHGRSIPCKRQDLEEVIDSQYKNFCIRAAANNLAAARADAVSKAYEAKNEDFGSGFKKGFYCNQSHKK